MRLGRIHGLHFPEYIIVRKSGLGVACDVPLVNDVERSKSALSSFGSSDHPWQMDAASESPQAIIKSDGNAPEEDKSDSGDDEQMLDWSKIGPKASKGVQKALPKRGEKAFEPIAVGPSAYQKFTLDRAREAMSEALSTPREIQTKRLSQAIWMPQYSLARVTDARGTVFDTVGFTIKRNDHKHKRLELLPEEVLYMVERGSMLCWRESSNVLPNIKEDVNDPVQLVGDPMSAQQCFAEMLGVGGITLEHYQVYAYLKRFGYTVRRAQSLPGYHEYAVYRHALPAVSFLSTIRARLTRLWNSMNSISQINWWSRFHPGIASYFQRTVHYPSLFKSFRVIPSFTPSRVVPLEPSSNYNVFFHVWKPDSPWNRLTPPRPDFDIVVINARTTPVPTIDELTMLFGTLPNSSYQPTQKVPVKKLQTPSGLLARYLAWIRGLLQSQSTAKGNAFAHLKAGKKSVIFAVVDAGTTSLYRFNEGCFDEWPMI